MWAKTGFERWTKTGFKYKNTGFEHGKNDFQGTQKLAMSLAKTGFETGKISFKVGKRCSDWQNQFWVDKIRFLNWQKLFLGQAKAVLRLAITGIGWTKSGFELERNWFCNVNIPHRGKKQQIKPFLSFRKRILLRFSAHYSTLISSRKFLFININFCHMTNIFGQNPNVLSAIFSYAVAHVYQPYKFCSGLFVPKMG